MTRWSRCSRRQRVGRLPSNDAANGPIVGVRAGDCPFHVKQPVPPALRFLDEALLDLERRNLLRRRPAPAPEGQLSFCSNDYLALAARPPPARASGSGASRLVTGERREHVELERAAADLVGQPEALVFSSGYAANVGVLAALAGPDELIVSDALNHASIVDGARLSRARTVIVPHLDLDAVRAALRGPRAGRALVVTESYFSMDADGPDLRALREICDRHDAALVVDEAHALGVLGRDGRGLCRDAAVTPDVVIGTFGKSFGAGGAFAAGCSALVTWLWNRARSFVFSTGLSPAVAAAGASGIETARLEPERRVRVLAASDQFRAGLRELGIEPRGFGPIVPWVVGEPARALSLASSLREAGIDVAAIRPPSVPAGTARLRFTLTAAHAPADVARALQVIAGLLARESR
jgi:8-amino-7-oxononanoate synthase